MHRVKVRVVEDALDVVMEQIAALRTDEAYR